MKLVPGPLPAIPTTTTASSMDRLPVPLPFSPDFLWRYPINFPSMGTQPPSSPLWDYKSQLPSSLATDPRIWSREDVSAFLRWAEREFDLQPINMEMFQINGKAMCLLTRTDLSDRAPGSGDVLHNVLQILVREANNLQRMLPSSPVTPTSRHPYPLSPHSHPPTPNWNLLAQSGGEGAFHPSHAASLAAHLMAQSNSVTLSPAPSVDSQAGSPQHTEAPQTFGHSIFGNGNSGGGSSNGSGSNPSDSDEDAMDLKQGYGSSPPDTPSYNQLPQMNWVPPKSPKETAQLSPGFFKREFFSSESPEPNTNGRLLWDFLQQLLNDPQQRYTSYIAWKNRETGVFKIVDPAGLAKLWGIQKNHLSMNYDKMSRALRYYYRVNILRKVQGERHCYQFLRNPSELKNIKNISLLRQQMQMSPMNLKSPTGLKPKPDTAGQMAPPTSQGQSFPQEPQPVQKSESPPQQLFKPNSQIQITYSSESPAEYKPQPPIVPQITIKAEPREKEPSPESSTQHRTAMEYDEKPTDLSMDGPRDLSNSRYVNIVCSPDPPISVAHQ